MVTAGKIVFVFVMATAMVTHCWSLVAKRDYYVDWVTHPRPNYASGGVCNGGFEEAKAILIKRVANCIQTGAIDIQFDTCCDPIFLRLTESGYYPIRGAYGYCDMENDGGGWLVIMRRNGGMRSFSKTWRKYKKGFGAVDRDYWMGLENIQRFTLETSTELRVDMKLANGTAIFARYGWFEVTHEFGWFRARVARYSEESTAGDGLGSMDGARFSTQDRDVYRPNGCSVQNGWWFNDDCNVTNLNEPYFDPDTNEPIGVRWIAPNSPYGPEVRVFSVEMKIRQRRWECGNHFRQGTSDLVLQTFSRSSDEDNDDEEDN